MNDGEWTRLVRQLKNGDCTPFLGSGASFGTLPTGRELSVEWAREHGYPFFDDHNLPNVTEYSAIEFGDTTSVKQMICEKIDNGRVPDPSDPYEPHRFLSAFPLPVFITTNYDNFLPRALAAQGKDPQVALCPWDGENEETAKLFKSKAGYAPSPDSPLVYHLHGGLQKPESIVLTQGDYLEFVARLAMSKASVRQRILPPPIQAALTTRSLLFIGYSLQDWTFRVLFHGLRSALPALRRRGNVSVQFSSGLDGPGADAESKGREYLTKLYGKWEISIFWGSNEEFFGELSRRMGLIS